MLAVQADGCSVRTVEALGRARRATAPAPGRPSGRRTALHGGFCTPGFLVSPESYLREHPDPDEHEIREALAGNICRCTGIVEAVSLAAQRLGEGS